MQYKSINQHLKPYSIAARRATTINHAFASAIAPHDEYDDEKIRAGVKQLGQNPDEDLRCVYCGSNAETWDHVQATVRNKKFSGFGHRLGNLLPCCKPCNSRKGNKAWSAYLDAIGTDGLARRKSLIESYLAQYQQVDLIPENLPEYEELEALRIQVLEIFQKADALAAQIRLKTRRLVEKD